MIMVKVETHWIGIAGETQSVTRSELTPNAAAIHVELIADDCRAFERRSELFALDGSSSVQCIYDTEGSIWRAIVYTETDRV